MRQRAAALYEQQRKADIRAKSALTKFDAGTDPLEDELGMSKIVPLQGTERTMMLKYLKKMEKRAANSAERNAIVFHRMQIQLQGSDAIVHHEFLRDWWSWMIGRGRQKDHDRTWWGRQSLTDDREVAAYLDKFVMKAHEYRLKLQIMRMRRPKGINETYLYYKYIVRGDEPHTTNYLADFELFLEQFQDARDKGQEIWDNKVHIHPHETAPYGDGERAAARQQLVRNENRREGNGFDGQDRRRGDDDDDSDNNDAPPQAPDARPPRGDHPPTAPPDDNDDDDDDFGGPDNPEQDWNNWNDEQVEQNLEKAKKDIDDVLLGFGNQPGPPPPPGGGFVFQPPPEFVSQPPKEKEEESRPMDISPPSSPKAEKKGKKPAEEDKDSTGEGRPPPPPPAGGGGIKIPIPVEVRPDNLPGQMEKLEQERKKWEENQKNLQKELEDAKVELERIRQKQQNQEAITAEDKKNLAAVMAELSGQKMEKEMAQNMMKSMQEAMSNAANFSQEMQDRFVKDLERARQGDAAANARVVETLRRELDNRTNAFMSQQERTENELNHYKNQVAAMRKELVDLEKKTNAKFEERLNIELAAEQARAREMMANAMGNAKNMGTAFQEFQRENQAALQQERSRREAEAKRADAAEEHAKKSHVRAEELQQIVEQLNQSLKFVPGDTRSKIGSDTRGRFKRNEMEAIYDRVKDTLDREEAKKGVKEREAESLARTAKRRIEQKTIDSTNRTIRRNEMLLRKAAEREGQLQQEMLLAKEELQAAQTISADLFRQVESYVKSLEQEAASAKKEAGYLRQETESMKKDFAEDEKHSRKIISDLQKQLGRLVERYNENVVESRRVIAEKSMSNTRPKEESVIDEEAAARRFTLPPQREKREDTTTETESATATMVEEESATEILKESEFDTSDDEKELEEALALSKAIAEAQAIPIYSLYIPIKESESETDTSKKRTKEEEEEDETEIVVEEKRTPAKKKGMTLLEETEEVEREERKKKTKK